MVQWLLQAAGANVEDAANSGRTVWDLTQTVIPSKAAEELAPVVKAMLARGAPPAAFLRALPAPLQHLPAQGAVVRARLPAGSAWRVRRDALIDESACGQCLPQSVLAVVRGYGEEGEEELWARAAAEAIAAAAVAAAARPLRRSERLRSKRQRTA